MGSVARFARPALTAVDRTRVASKSPVTIAPSKSGPNG